jgi:hypothetical protein
MKAAMIRALLISLAVGGLSTLGANLQNKTEEVGPAPTSSDGGSGSSEALQLVVSTEKSSFSVGEPILLTVTSRNNGRKVLVLENTFHAEWDYKLDVRNEAGESVALTEEGRRLTKNNSIYASTNIDLHPGEEVQKDFVITKLFEMTTPGKYSISVNRQFWIPDLDVYRPATSNTVKITIVE